MQTVILMRHGYPTSWDEPPKPRGSPPHLRLDPGLAAIGHDQARVTAAHLLEAGEVTAVITSPFRRCLETADAFAANCSAGITPDWRVGEVLLSQVLGCPFSPSGAMDPEWAERRDGAGKPSHPESDRTIQERVAKLIGEVKERKPFAQRIVIVSHEIILKELFRVMSGRQQTPAIDWHPCALATLTRAKPVDRQWRLVGELAGYKHLGAADRIEPHAGIALSYHPLDSRS